MDVVEALRQTLIEHGYDCEEIVSFGRRCQRSFGVNGVPGTAAAMIYTNGTAPLVVTVILVRADFWDRTKDKHQILDFDLADPDSVPQLLEFVDGSPECHSPRTP